MRPRDSAPDALVVFDVRRPDARCARCGDDSRSWFQLLPRGDGRDQDATCMRCAGLDDLVLVPTGDPRFTRRVKAHSTRAAALVQWARARKRYERAGWLVEPAAIDAAFADLAREGYQPLVERRADGSWWTTRGRPRLLQLGEWLG